MSGVVRGCGSRVQGGSYLVTHLGPNGRPVEDFLIDPTEPFPLESLGITPRGVYPIERDGVTHVVDWVGSADYLNVADFVEEVRRHGLSRRIPRTFDFSLLTPESRIIVLHARAFVEDPAPFYERAPRRADGRWFCPTHKALHEAIDNERGARWSLEGSAYALCCAGVWWHDVDGGHVDAEWPQEAMFDGRPVIRKMPAFEYRAWRVALPAPPRYSVAAFASFPLSGIEVVRCKNDRRHILAAEAAGKGTLAVDVTDE
jgi:hypothetical protein